MSNKFQHRNLPMLLLQARESVMRYFRSSVKSQGLTEQQWRVIRVLNECGEIESGKIAEQACILPPSLSGVLDRMERDDLIVRYRLSTDQRKVFVDLTPRSRKIMNNISQAIEVQYGLLEKDLGQSKLLAAYALLDELIALPEPVEKEIVRTRLTTKSSQEKPAARTKTPRKK